MKRILSICILALMMTGIFTPLTFAEDLFFNTINDQVYLYNEETYEQATVGYTVSSSSESDWNLKEDANEDGDLSYTASVGAGTTIAAQMNSLGEVQLSVSIAVYDENNKKIADKTIDNSDSSEMIEAELEIPDNAQKGEVLLKAEVPGGDDFALSMDFTCEKKGGAAASSTDEESDITDWAMEDQAEEAEDLGSAVEELARGAVKTLILAGIIGIGAIAAIIHIIKGKAAEKAVEAGVKSVSNEVPPENTEGVGESYVVTDPATGAQRIYVKDASGNFVSEDGDSVLDMDSLSDWQESRSKDRAWQDKSNENLNNPTKFEDIDKQEALENEKIKRETYEEKIAIKHGMDTSDMDAVYDKVSHDQGLAEVEGQKWQERADNFDTAVKVSENLRTVADYSVSALGAVTGPAGTVVKDVYAFGTNLGDDVMTAIAEGKDAYDVAQAAAGAVTKTAVEVIQNNVTGVKSKVYADIAGGAVSGGTDSYIEGEDVVSGIAKGAAEGTFSAVVDAGGEMAGVIKDESSMSSLAKDLVSSATDTTGDLIKNEVPDAVEKSFEKTFEDLKKKND